MTGFQPCEGCGKNRFRTIIKKKRWICRVCGKIRDKKKL